MATDIEGRSPLDARPDRGVRGLELADGGEKIPEAGGVEFLEGAADAGGDEEAVGASQTDPSSLM